MEKSERNREGKCDIMKKNKEKMKLKDNKRQGTVKNEIEQV